MRRELNRQVPKSKQQFLLLNIIGRQVMALMPEKRALDDFP